MLKADIIITSNGRTTFEAASLGVPGIAIAQNDREMKHLFGDVTRTIINLGMHNSVSEESFLNCFNNLVNSPEKRKAINRRMLSLDLHLGVENVLNKIMNYFYEYNRKNF